MLKRILLNRLQRRRGVQIEKVTEDMQGLAGYMIRVVKTGLRHQAPRNAVLLERLSILCDFVEQASTEESSPDGGGE